MVKNSADRRKKAAKTLKLMWNLKWIYLMLLPVVAYYIIFKYIPMYGVTIAFKDYNVFKGMLESPWVGFKVFEKIFASKNFWHSVKNTLVLNLLTLAVNFPLTKMCIRDSSPSGRMLWKLSSCFEGSGQISGTALRQCP